MEIIDDLVKHEPNFDKLASFYINNPKRASYMLVLASDKAEKYKTHYQDIWEYVNLFFSFIGDYITGVYRDVSIKTVFLSLSAIVYFVYPKKTVLDFIPGVKIMKQVAVIKGVIHSLEKDLLKYAEFKKDEKKFIEI